MNELLARIPGSIETHSQVPHFFFDADLELRRHDCNPTIAGDFGGSQLTSDYAVANGIRLPTMRRAYARGPIALPSWKC